MQVYREVLRGSYFVSFPSSSVLLDMGEDASKKDSFFPDTIYLWIDPQQAHGRWRVHVLGLCAGSGLGNIGQSWAQANYP